MGVFTVLTGRMPKTTFKKQKSEEAPTFGTVLEDLEVPVASEVVFRKTWRIRNFKKIVAKQDYLDSPEFMCSVNGMSTYWNVSVRFWKDSNGKKVINPLVLCLNLTGSKTEDANQARIRYQFGIWDASISYWEYCDISNIVLNLDNNNELISIGYRTVGIHDRHFTPENDVKIMVKIQIIQNAEEKHSLSQDLARVLETEDEEYLDTVVENATQVNLKANSLLIKARSNVLGAMLRKCKDPNNSNIRYTLDLSELNPDLIKELLRYIYTDKVDNADTFANKLLTISRKFNIPGLTSLCERNLLENMTPSTVPNILLLADRCGCENLRKAALHYCENCDTIKENVHMDKSFVWRVMEMVNPNLFQEACESIGSSASTLDSPGIVGSYSDCFDH